MDRYGRQKQNVQVFVDTLYFIHINKTLTDATEQSIKSTVIYRENEYPEINTDKIFDTNILVTKSRTFEAAIRNYKEHKDKKIAVLNFASATTPGGGVTFGSSAQEEALCRCSTLYSVLNTNYLLDNFYQRNSDASNPLNNDDIIYTKDIIICKTDTDHPTRLQEKDFVKVDVITCAAPNLRERPSNEFNISNGEHVSISDEELYKIHLQRAKHILHIAKLNDVEILILGAFGCGAFRNNPKVVARAFKDALNEYKKSFFIVEFAIYTRPYEEENFLAFEKTFIK